MVRNRDKKKTSRPPTQVGWLIAWEGGFAKNESALNSRTGINSALILSPLQHVRERLGFFRSPVRAARKIFWKAGSTNMKVKIVLAVVVAFSCVPMVPARNKFAYPDENVAQFVVDKLDVTSLPSAFRPKKEKGKKTFVDYGFQPQNVRENDVVITEGGGAKSLSIKVLEHTSAGISVCIAQVGVKSGTPASESVVLLKWNDREGSLKGHATLREFAECPSIGGDASESSY